MQQVSTITNSTASSNNIGKESVRFSTTGRKCMIYLGLFLLAFSGYSQSGYLTFPNDRNRNIHVLNAARNTVAPWINSGIKPRGLAVSSDGTKIYIANRGPRPSIVVANASSGATTPIQEKINVSINAPYGVAISPDDSRVYVTDEGRNEVLVVDPIQNTVIENIGVGVNPAGIIVSPDNSRVYVANTGSNSISVIDATQNLEIAQIPVSNPFAIEITPDGSKIYVTQPQSGIVSVINTSDYCIPKTIPLTDPRSLAIVPAGTKLYVSLISGQVAVINILDDTIIETITVGTGTTGISVNPNGKRVYVVNSGSRTISVIDVAADRVVSTIPFANPLYGGLADGFGRFFAVKPSPGPFPSSSNPCPSICPKVFDDYSLTPPRTVATLLAGDPEDIHLEQIRGMNPSFGFPTPNSTIERKVQFRVGQEEDPTAPNYLADMDFGQETNLVYSGRGLIVNTGLGTRPSILISYNTSPTDSIDLSCFRGLRLGLRARTNVLKGNVVLFDDNQRVGLATDILPTQIRRDYWVESHIDFPFASFPNISTINLSSINRFTIQLQSNYRLGGHDYIIDKVEFY